MPRPKSIIPSYRLHRATGQAVAYVDRRPVYLGRYGSPESRVAFSGLLDRLRSGEVVANVKTAREPQKTVVTLHEVLLRFATEELKRYSDAEQRCIRGAIRCTRELYGDTPAAEFGPLRLRTVREAMIRKGWSRSFINKQIKRLRLIIRWAVGWELIPPSVVDALAAVKSLSYGDSDAEESRPRRAIPEDDLQSVRAVLCPKHQDIFDLMLLTGCRPGELLGLTLGQIDRRGEVWRADLLSHKTRHHGKTRTLFFNSKAQSILLRHMTADPDMKLFSIRVDTFSNAVKTACEIAFGMPEDLRKRGRELTPEDRAQAKAWRREHVFTPHWLRHTVATRLADEVGTEAAQRLLGHATAAMTLHYSKSAEKQAIAAVKKLG